MSLLQEILDKMYVEPELLNQLDEEQKQTLYIKMREEQIRRWKLHEDEAEREPPKSRTNKLKWLTGRDGEIWVWVMGDHPNDSSIDNIIEKEVKSKAREIAETEALTNSLIHDEPPPPPPPQLSTDLTAEQYWKQQLSKMNLYHDMKEGGSNGIQQSNLSLYDEVDKPTTTNIPIISYQQQKPSQPAPSYKPTTATVTNGNGNGTYTPPPQNPIKKITTPVVPPPIPNRPAFLLNKKSTAAAENEKSRENSPSLPNYKRDNINSSPQVYPVPITIRSTNNSGPVPFPSGGEHTIPSRYQPTSAQNVPIRHAAATNNNDNNKDGNGDLIRMRPSQNRMVLSPDEEIHKRESEIYERLMEERDRLNREAEEEEERRRNEFEEQERKAHEAEAKIRLVAQRAREQYEKSLRTSDSLLPALNEGKITSLKEAIKRSRPPKPANREAIIQWFISTELPKGTGLDPKTKYPARWFHGIMSRAETEKLLADKPPGSFLVRISERIWGYAISYVIGDGNMKHFLVEAISDGYQFLGTNQIVHKSLYDLVLYHETAPITAKGKEILRNPVGQTSAIPDYSDLIDTSDMFKFPYRAEMIRRF